MWVADICSPKITAAKTLATTGFIKKTIEPKPAPTKESPIKYRIYANPDTKIDIYINCGITDISMAKAEVPLKMTTNGKRIILPNINEYAFIIMLPIEAAYFLPRAV